METNPTAPLAATPASDDAQKRRLIARVNPKDHVRTEGEKKFDRLTYTTVGYIINALLSVVAVYWVERTHSGQSWMNRRIEGAQKAFSLKSPDTAKMIATKSFFLAGGFAVMLPMKWLEDAKVRLVKKWDQKIYGDRVDTDPMIIQSHKDLEQAPKQSWSSILGSRILALIPFYLLIGALWDNKSALSKWTNPELRGMSKEAIKEMEVANPSGFATMASKGIYFDHPIATASRYIGKKIAQLRGKTEIIEQIEKAEKEFPGMLTHPKFGSETSHDPNHTALPYYFISEAITSGVVAWGVYALTRILGPIMGKKQAAPEAVVPPAVTAPAVPPTPEPVHTLPPAADVAEAAKREERPEGHAGHTKPHTAHADVAEETAVHHEKSHAPSHATLQHEVPHPPVTHHDATPMHSNADTHAATTHTTPRKPQHEQPHTPAPHHKVQLSGMEHQATHEPQQHAIA